MVERVGLGDPAPARADLERELGLGVDVRRLGRQHDRVAVADQGVVELAEEERLRRRIVAELGRVLGVVSSDADDLHSEILTRLDRSATRRPTWL